MQASRSVDDDYIAAARLGRRDRIEYDRGRIRALAVAHDVRARALRPNLKLVGGGSAERIRGGQHDLFALAHIAGGQLADRRGLAHAVDADHQHNRRLA